YAAFVSSGSASNKTFSALTPPAEAPMATIAGLLASLRAPSTASLVASSTASPHSPRRRNLQRTHPFTTPGRGYHDFLYIVYTNAPAPARDGDGQTIASRLNIMGE